MIVEVNEQYEGPDIPNTYNIIIEGVRYLWSSPPQKKIILNLKEQEVQKLVEIILLHSPIQPKVPFQNGRLYELNRLIQNLDNALQYIPNDSMIYKALNNFRMACRQDRDDLDASLRNQKDMTTGGPSFARGRYRCSENHTRYYPQCSSRGDERFLRR